MKEAYRYMKAYLGAESRGKLNVGVILKKRCGDWWRHGKIQEWPNSEPRP
jgi:hypothetical protein